MNLELIWLLEGLVPSYRTIAEFRRVNGEALRAASREFVLCCRELDLLGGEEIAIDGAFFNASASDASVEYKRTLAAKFKAQIAAHHELLERSDAQDAQSGEPFGNDPALADELERFRAYCLSRVHEKLEASMA